MSRNKVPGSVHRATNMIKKLKNNYLQKLFKNYLTEVSKKENTE